MRCPNCLAAGAQPEGDFYRCASCGKLFNLRGEVQEEDA